MKPRAPEDVAGVRSGDLIERVDGEAVTGWSLHRVQVVFAVPGNHTLVVRRDDGEHELNLVIREPKELAESRDEHERR